MFRTGVWAWSREHAELCQVIETQALWGETICHVWLPGKDTIVRLPTTCLHPVSEASVGTVDGIAYITAAARVADALTQDVLLAPIEGGGHE